jgi:general secretion pathway protein G
MYYPLFKTHTRKNQKGFTLIEIMVVVVILGILASIVVPKIISRPEQAKVVKAKQDVQAIESALELYKLDNGFYPSTDQGLQALVTKPTTDPIPDNWKDDGYLKEVPMDPWNRPYQYLNPGTHNDIDVFTYGPTGQPGGTGPNATIGNWTEQPNNNT